MRKARISPGLPTCRVAGWTGLENEISPAPTHAHRHPPRVVDGESFGAARAATFSRTDDASECRNVASDSVCCALERAQQDWLYERDAGQLRRVLLELILLLDR
jgi:hypothetical protein